MGMIKKHPFIAVAAAAAVVYFLVWPKIKEQM